MDWIVTSLCLSFDQFFFLNLLFLLIFYFWAKVSINLVKEIFCSSFFLYPNVFSTCFLTCGLLDPFFFRPEL